MFEGLTLKLAWGAFVGFLKRVPWQIWAALLVLLMLWGLYATGVHAGRAEVQVKFNAYKAEVIGATAVAKQHAQAKEAADRAAIATAAAQFKKDVSDAKRESRQLAADLRAGRRQLQKRWTCAAGVPGAATDPAAADAAAADRAESASRIIGAADEADALIRALQDILRAERNPPP